MKKIVFFKQLDKKLKTDGVIELLRKGMRYKHLRLDLFYVRPSLHNPDAAENYAKNIEQDILNINGVKDLVIFSSVYGINIYCKFNYFLHKKFLKFAIFVAMGISLSRNL